MKIFLQAIHAVTVEALGVLLVVWMLFGLASWSFGQGNVPASFRPQADQRESLSTRLAQGLDSLAAVYRHDS